VIKAPTKLTEEQWQKIEPLLPKFQQSAKGVWERVWRVFVGLLDAQGLLDWDETFADGSFAPAKRGARASGKPNVGKV